jgi:iron complex outermembrane receptor protein
MKSNLYRILLPFLILSFGYAQSQTLKGKVTDTTGAPLAGATIKINNQGVTVTDQSGSFSANCIVNGEVAVSFVGYESQSQNILDCDRELSFQLTASTKMLEGVEITATSTQNKLMLNQPSSISKLGEMEIKRGTGLFLDDAINANVPGVFMQRRTISAGQQFNIRGYGGGGPGPRGVNNNFDSQGIKAYLNGIPITDAEGITLMDDIDFGSIGNVEILKGPSGTLYGMAIAGVVNLQTVRPEKNKTSVSQSALFGSYGLKRFTTTLQIGTDHGSLLVNYGKQKYDGFMPHTNSTKDFVNVMGEFQLSSKQSLTAYLGYSDSYDQRNGELTIDQFNDYDYSGNPAYIKNDAHSNVTSVRAGIGHTYKFKSNISNTTSLFGTGLTSNASSAGGWTDKLPVNFGFRSVFNTNFNLSDNIRLNGVTGIETQKQISQTIAYPMIVNNADPTGYNIIGAIRSDQSSITSNMSLFTQWTLSLPYDFSLTAGVGSSKMDITLIDKFYVAANNTVTNKVPTTYETSYKNMTSPTVALNKLLMKNMSVYASFSQAYRAPVAANIYTPLAGTANTDLKPEKGTQMEIGSKGNLLGGNLTYEIAYFNSKFSDKMTVVAVPNAAKTATLYTYVINSGNLNNKGVELLVKYNAYHSESGFIKMVRPFVNFTYSDFKYENFTFQNNATVAASDYSGLAVAGVPKRVWNAGIDITSNSGAYFNATYLHRDEMPITPDGLNVAQGYSLINSKIGFRKTFATHWETDAYFGANNMSSNRNYQMVFVNQLPDAYLAGPKKINYFGGLSLKYIF